jgi:hypothetical protein
MRASDPIADSLPPPRDDEPADLRSDIIDELSDHLDCAVQRELLRGKDETDARRTAIQRFGDIPKIARQLWWDAMKERIMTGRVSLALSIGVVFLMGIFGMLGWQIMQDQRELNQRVLTKLESLPSGPKPGLAEPRSPEWGSLTITLLDAQSNPLAGHPVRIKGKMYSSDTDLDLKFETDNDGRVKIDPLRTGTGYEMWIESQEGWLYFIDKNNLVLRPGEDRTYSVQQPPINKPAAQVSFTFEWPDEPEFQNTQFIYLFTSMPIKTTDSGKWYTPQHWELIANRTEVQSFKKITVWPSPYRYQPSSYRSKVVDEWESFVNNKTNLNLQSDDPKDATGMITPVKNLPLTLPAGEYKLRMWYVTQEPPIVNGCGYFQSELNQVAFQINEGQENTIEMPLPHIPENINRTILDILRNR